MKIFAFNLILFSLLLVMFACNDPVSNSSTVIATEEWHLTVPQTQSNAEITLDKRENGKMSVNGSWKYDFYGNEITCKIMDGTVIKDSTNLTFNCNGTASYPPDSTGYIESSPFKLIMEGKFQNGYSSGNWQISFTDSVWNEWAPEGTFSGQRKTGTGITE